eukprot:11217152-Lingulodinium_polyedra.AAC.1
MPDLSLTSSARAQQPSLCRALGFAATAPTLPLAPQLAIQLLGPRVNDLGRGQDVLGPLRRLLG